MATKVMSIRIDENDLSTIEEFAADQGMTRNEYIVQALARQLPQFDALDSFRKEIKENFAERFKPELTDFQIIGFILADWLAYTSAELEFWGDYVKTKELFALAPNGKVVQGDDLFVLKKNAYLERFKNCGKNLDFPDLKTLEEMENHLLQQTKNPSSRKDIEKRFSLYKNARRLMDSSGQPELDTKKDDENDIQQT